MKSWKTNPEELADIIFKSSEADLNDLLRQIVSTGKYDIGQLLLDISASVNNSLPDPLRADGCEPRERQLFLKEEIRAELIYHIFLAARTTRMDALTGP